MRILVAEDEDTLRRVIVQVLTADGYEVTEAASAERALELFREDPFPIVFSDIVMSGLSGLDLLHAVKEISSDCVFVIMTSHASLETATTALREGAYDFLTKPFDDIDVLTNVATRAVEKYRLSQENVKLIEDLQRNGQELQRLNKALQDMANRDPLTGLYNRRYFLEVLDREIARAKRHGRSLSVLMIDVDHFKRYNDTHGHLAGDEALRTVARAMFKHLRTCNVAARYGGEEFIIMAIETEKKGAMIAAERFRVLLAETPILDPGGGDRLPSLTVSIGVSTFAADAVDSHGLLQAADQALYRAKDEGRDRVCAAPGLTDPAPEPSSVPSR